MENNIYTPEELRYFRRNIEDLEKVVDIVSKDPNDTPYKEGYTFPGLSMEIVYIPHHFFLQYTNSENRKCTIPISEYAFPKEYYTIHSKEEILKQLHHMIDSLRNNLPQIN